MVEVRGPGRLMRKLCLTPHFGDYPAKHCGAKALTAAVPPLLAQTIQVWNLKN